MAKAKKTSIKGKMTFSTTQVMLFVAAFAAVGAVAIWQTLAAPSKFTPGTCSPVTPITVGQNYDALISGLPKESTLYNMFTTYGDGSTWNYVIGYEPSPDGTRRIGGYPAKISGTTTFKLTGVERNNPKATRVYATCVVQVNPV